MSRINNISKKNCLSSDSQCEGYQEFTAITIAEMVDS